VIGLARGDGRLRTLVGRAQVEGVSIRIPTVVLAETVRGNGPRDAAVNLVLHSAAPHRPLDEPTARLAGSLLAAARSNATVDALVAAEAIHHRPSIVLTADPDDLGALIAGHSGVAVERV
jgi:predicted nucleic acid-binding protein